MPLKTSNRPKITSPDVKESHPLYKLQSSINDFDQIKGKWLAPLTKANISKPTFFIINGWMAYAEDNLDLYTQVSDMVTVFAYDYRGIGQSTRNGNMTVTHAALDTNHLFVGAINQKDKQAREWGINPGSNFVMASCMGTITLAAMYAYNLPLCKLIAGNILISPVSKIRVNPIITSLYFLPEKLVQFTSKYLSEPFIKIVFKGDDAEDARNQSRDRVKRITSTKVIKHAQQYMWKSDVGSAWASIDKPTMIIIGENDPLTSIPKTKRIARKIKNSVLVKLEAPSHLLLEYNIEWLRDNFSRFIQDPSNFRSDNI